MAEVISHERAAVQLGINRSRLRWMINRCQLQGVTIPGMMDNHLTLPAVEFIQKQLAAFDAGQSARYRGKRGRGLAQDGQVSDEMGERASALETGAECQIEETATAKTISTKGEHVRTVEEALAFAKVDTAIWAVDRFVINSWQVAMKGTDGEPRMTDLWQVKVWLKRVVSPSVEAGIHALLTRIAARAPSYTHIAYRPVTDPHLLEVSLFDHHFGLLSWRRETGADYDLKIAETLYAGAIDDILRKASSYPIERILLPLGNDFLNTDNLENSTAHGTPQDVDGRFAKIIESSTMAVIHGIDKLASVAPVTVLLVPGNHDTVSSWHVARFLWAYYRNCDNVTVDIEPRPRKYLHYGVNLIGFTHGNEEPHRALPVIMATEKAAEWSQTQYHEFHLGHLHKAKETQFVSVDTLDGVVVRILPSLCANSAWAASKGYLPTRVAEAHLYSREHGPTGYFMTRG